MQPNEIRNSDARGIWAVIVTAEMFQWSGRWGHGGNRPDRAASMIGHASSRYDLITAAEAGATAVIQPGGSMNDDQVIAAADAAGLAMVFTGQRHFRH